MTQRPDEQDVDIEQALVRYMVERRITRRMLLEQIGKVGAFAALAPIIAACTSAAASAAPSQAAAATASAPPTAAPTAATAAPTATPEPTPVPTPEKQLNIYNWDAYIGETTRQDFEKKYGIKVNYDKFPDASTQITKIRSDGKGGGYDLTYPASTDVAPLARDGVIAALDLSLIPNIKNLGPAWQDPAYDPGNKNSVPNYWWTTGIAWDPDKVKKDITSWTALWDEAYKGKMGMLSDQQEVFAAGAFRLGLNPNPTSDADLDAILALLETQKPLLRKYTEDDIGDFTSGQLWMTQAWSGDWVQMAYEKPKAKYVIPSEGAIRGSDVMVVLSGAKNPIAAHLWIDYNLDAKVSAANSNYIGYMGPNAAAQAFIDPAILGNPQLNPDAGVYNALVELVTLEGPALDNLTKAVDRAHDLVAVAPDPSPSLRARLSGGLLVLPGIGWLVGFFLVPLLIIFVVSFGSKDATGHVVLSDLGLRNYIEALKPEFLPAFGNSIRYSLLTTVLSILIGYPIAYWISRHGGRRKILLLILVMLPFWTSYLIRTYAWMIILRDNGVANSILMSLGLTSDPIPFLNTDFAVVLGMTYGFLPFAILPLYVSIDRLDDNLVQAARDLYASGRGAFLHVILPLTMPGIIAAAVLTFIPAMGDYVTPDLLGGAQTSTIAKIVQVLFTSGRDWPYGSALGFMLMVITLAGTLFAIRALRQETFG